MFVVFVRAEDRCAVEGLYEVVWDVLVEVLPVGAEEGVGRLCEVGVWVEWLGS